MKTVTVAIAAHEGVELSLKLEGNLWSHLTVRDIHATGSGKSPVRKIDIERAHFEYDLKRLFRDGISYFLSSYELKNATLELELVPGRERSRKASELTKLIRETLQQPALFTDNLDITNVNLLVHTPDGDFRVKGLSARLHTTEDGFIDIREVEIPKIVTWRNLHTDATFQRRRLVVKDFLLGKDIRIDRVEIDSSRRVEGIDFLVFEGQIFDGKTRFYLWRRARARNNPHAEFSLYSEGVALAKLRSFLRWKPEITGTANFWLQLAGPPDLPRRWEGNSLLQLENATLEENRLASGRFQLLVDHGRAKLTEGLLKTGDNQMTVQWEAKLPKTFKEFADFKATPDYTLHCPDVAAISPRFSKGNVQGSGHLEVDADGVDATFKGTVADLRINTGRFALGITSGTTQAEASFNKKLPRPSGAGDLYPLTLKAEATAATIQAGPALLDSGHVTLSVEKERLAVQGKVVRGPNHAELTGESAFPFPEKGIPEGSLSFRIHAPEVAALAAQGGRFDGTLVAHGNLQHKEGRWNGLTEVEANDLLFHTFAAKRLKFSLPVSDSSLAVHGLELQINEKDRLTGEATFALKAPYDYEGRLNGSISDLTPLAKLTGKPLQGAVTIDWHGAGRVGTLQHTGEGRLEIKQGIIDTLTGLQVEIAGTYSPEVVELAPVSIRSHQGSLETRISMHNQQLAVKPLRIDVPKLGTIEGYLQLPVDLASPDTKALIFPKDGTIDVALKLQQLDLATLSAAPVLPSTAQKKGKTPPPGILKGTVKADLVGKGTVARPEVTLSVTGEQLAHSSATKVPPVKATLTARYLDDLLTVKAGATIPNAQPIDLSGQLPLPVEQVLEEKGLPKATPLQFDLTLPSSPATVLTPFVPLFRYVEGRVGFSAQLRGTLEAPSLSGGAQIDLPALRFSDTNLPGINGFKGDLVLNGTALQFRRFHGDVAGGTFGVGGQIDFSNLFDPQINLRLQSKGTLLYRNDSLTVRADSDLHIFGPLKTAEVKGLVGINKSRFYREIDILPIGLPGKQAPQRASATAVRPEISVREAPFRDWKLDVTVKTTEPFQIRSNLARGSAFADVHIGGTGLSPQVEGMARIENFVATLPFSRLEVQQGFVYFNPAEPFNPMLDIHGTSRVRNHTINAYVYGTAEEPNTLFTSEPPLPQEEVIALLATGATTSEFAQNDQALAGRATMLLLQDLYHKLFKRRTPPPTQPGEGEPFVDRFQLDIGSVDPRTGRQEVGGRFRLTDQFEVGAGLDAAGDVRVQLQYLLRFQ